MCSVELHLVENFALNPFGIPLHFKTILYYSLSKNIHVDIQICGHISRMYLISSCYPLLVFYVLPSS